MRVEPDRLGRQFVVRARARPERKKLTSRLAKPGGVLTSDSRRLERADKARSAVLTSGARRSRA
jgi:hypothetical protein